MHLPTILSRLYPRLQLQFLPSLAASSVFNWKKDFPEINSTDDLVLGYSAITRTTSSEIWHETQFLILHRAYSTFFREPDTQSTSDRVSRCPKCNGLRPSLAHMLWHCLQVSFFWDQIALFVNTTLSQQRPKLPLLILFGIADEKLHLRKNKWPNTPPSPWEHICCLVARRYLLRNWILSIVPTLDNFLADWIRSFSWRGWTLNIIQICLRCPSSKDGTSLYMLLI